MRQIMTTLALCSLTAACMSNPEASSHSSMGKADGFGEPGPGGQGAGGSIISEQQARSVLAELEDECPDTFCGGDYSYFFTDGSLSCPGDGSCSLVFHVMPGGDQKFPAAALDGIDLARLTTIDWYGTFSSRVLSTAMRDMYFNEQAVQIAVECELVGDYYTARDVVDPDGDPAKDFRDNFLDCIYEGMESALGELPVYTGLLTEFERENVLSALDDECPDTFCGGDYSFFLADDDGSLSCIDGVCSIEFAVAPFDEQWADDPTAGMDPTTLTESNGAVTVTVTGSKGDEADTRVTARCDIDGSFYDPSEVYDRDGDAATDGFRSQFLDCIRMGELGVFAALPIE